MSKKMFQKNSLASAVALCTMLMGVQSLAVAEESWADRITLSGVAEAEISVNGNDESDMVVATIELGVDAQVNEWVNVHLRMLYEEDETASLGVDEGIITLGNAEQSSFSVAVGRMYLPFGVYDTNLLSDPLTLELGETSETAAQVMFEQGPLTASLFVYNGDTKEAGGG